MSGATHQVTLELPETWVKLPERERNGLLLAGVYEATRARSPTASRNRRV